MRSTRLAAATFLFAIIAGFTAMAGTWKNDSKGWRYDEGNGSYIKNTWKWIDGNKDGISECYYFDADGYCLVNTTTPNGWEVDSNGAWIVDGVVRTKTANASTPGIPTDLDSARWLDLTSLNSNKVVLDGSRYRIMAVAYGRVYNPDEYVRILDAVSRGEYIVDSNTVFEYKYTDPATTLPEYQPGDTALQWFARLCNNGSLRQNDIFKVKVSGNHIDAFTDITSEY